MAGLDKGFLVGLPDAVDHGRMAGVGRRTMIKLTAEVDDLHEGFLSQAIRRRQQCWRVSSAGASGSLSRTRRGAAARPRQKSPVSMDRTEAFADLIVVRAGSESIPAGPYSSLMPLAIAVVVPNAS